MLHPLISSVCRHPFAEFNLIGLIWDVGHALMADCNAGSRLSQNGFGLAGIAADLMDYVSDEKPTAGICRIGG